MTFLLLFYKLFKCFVNNESIKNNQATEKISLDVLNNNASSKNEDMIEESDSNVYTINA